MLILSLLPDIVKEYFTNKRIYCFFLRPHFFAVYSREPFGLCRPDDILFLFVTPAVFHFARARRTRLFIAVFSPALTRMRVFFYLKTLFVLPFSENSSFFRRVFCRFGESGGGFYRKMGDIPTMFC